MRYLKEYLEWNEKEDMLEKYPELTEDDVENPLIVDLNDIYETLCVEKTPAPQFGQDVEKVRYVNNKYPDITFENLMRMILMGNIVSYRGLCECYGDHWGKVTVVEVEDVTPIGSKFGTTRFSRHKEVSVKTLDNKKHPIDMNEDIMIYNNKEKVKSLLFKYVDSKKNQVKFDL